MTVQYSDSDYETTDSRKIGSKSGGCFGCLARVPCASLVAWIILIVGLGGFSAASYIGVVRTRDLFDVPGGATLNSNSWDDCMQITRIALIAVNSVTFPFGTLFLVVAWFSSGSSPQLLLNSSKKNIAGRTCNVLVLILAYLLNVAWLLVLGITLIPFYFMVLIWYLKDCKKVRCIDVNNYGLGLSGDTEYCIGKETNDLEAFWERMFMAWVCWVAALGGAFLVILSLVHFMVAIGGNLKHLKVLRPGNNERLSNDSMQRYETKL